MFASVRQRQHCGPNTIAAFGGTLTAPDAAARLAVSAGGAGTGPHRLAGALQSARRAVPARRRRGQRSGVGPSHSPGRLAWCGRGRPGVSRLNLSASRSTATWCTWRTPAMARAATTRLPFVALGRSPFDRRAAMGLSRRRPVQRRWHEASGGRGRRVGDRQLRGRRSGRLSRRRFAVAAGSRSVRERVPADRPDAGLFVSNAHGGTGNGTVSAFSDATDGALTPIGSLRSGLSDAPCWVEIVATDESCSRSTRKRQRLELQDPPAALLASPSASLGSALRCEALGSPTARRSGRGHWRSGRQRLRRRRRRVDAVWRLPRRLSLGIRLRSASSSPDTTRDAPGSGRDLGARFTPAPRRASQPSTRRRLAAAGGLTRTVRALPPRSFEISTASPVRSVLISFGWTTNRSASRRVPRPGVAAEDRRRRSVGSPPSASRCLPSARSSAPTRARPGGARA